MLHNEFSQNHFKPEADFQRNLMQNFIRLRAKKGAPHRLRILRSLAKTRHFTHSVYPPGWKFV